MRQPTPIAALVLALMLVGCSSAIKGDRVQGGTASVTLNGSTYRVRDVKFLMETGESPWFRIEGEPMEQADAECLPGLDGGLMLYGDLPSTVSKPLDLIGKRLRIEFTGDGDDANFCFARMGGLAGAEEAWVTVESVSGKQVTFTMSGTFKIYDENAEGGVAPATATGTAMVEESS